MNIITCDQRSDEWHQARLGKWTASSFSKLLTPTGKPSAQAKDVSLRLAVESIVGKPDQTFKSAAMERGTELEQEAFDYINFTMGYNFESCGFIDSSEGFGCSPDGIDFENKIGLELKCPLAHTHLEYLIDGKLPPEYVMQVQGSMLVTGFDRWLFCSYHPDMQSLVLVIERDQALIGSLEAVLKDNCRLVQKYLDDYKRLET